MSLEEFYKEAPPEISRPAITLNEPHQQTLARLDWELEQRKRWVSGVPIPCPRDLGRPLEFWVSPLHVPAPGI